MYSLKGKTVLVTGANRGIGLGFITTLLEAGADRIYAAVRLREDEAAVAALSPEVVRVRPLDLSDDASIDALVARIERLDVLVNNAGIVTGATCSGIGAVDKARQEMAVNLFGPMRLTSGLLPVLKQSEAAAIVNVSSIAAITNFPGIGTYSVSKAAMMSYTEGLRADLADSGIRVMGVYPGPHDTRIAPGENLVKPAPENVAIQVLKGLEGEDADVYPDDFARRMYVLFRENPAQVASLFAQMS